MEISDSSTADREDGQGRESDKGDGNKEVDEEIDDSQVNPPENPPEVRDSETTLRTENEGVDQSVNADPPGLSVDGEDVAREQAKDVEE